MVHSSRLGRIGTREVLEIKTFLFQLLMTRKAFSVRIQFQQNVVVARQDAIDFSHHIDLFVGLLVVIAVAA